MLFPHDLQSYLFGGKSGCYRWNLYKEHNPKKKKKKSQSPAGCCAALVPHRLRQSPGRVPIDVMETLKLLRMIHVYAVLLSSPTQIEVDFNPDNL